TNNSRNRSGVPLLQDIPLLGNLFSSRSDSKQRTELVVLMHPIVMDTPDQAAAQVSKEIQTLPGVSQAMYEDKVNEQQEMKKVQMELRRERAQAQSQSVGEMNSGGNPSNPSATTPSSSGYNLFQPATPQGQMETNAVTYPDR
ncbi:MAG TPA: hypothetical protein VMA13_00485, partial [Candidatus Saccharimonadales bacterium]|nr:hypothetical protein [Candidatus Saccharimonadales bacterium]